MFTVTDDSGLLALVVPTTYSTFVDSAWTLPQLLDHFRAEMAKCSLLVWGTGQEGIWAVDLRQQPAHETGSREAVGPLRVIGGRVLLTNYESLTMAAQYPDVVLPQPHEAAQVLQLEDGDYRCRIIQKFDPDSPVSSPDSTPAFIIELLRTEAPEQPWQHVQWFATDPDQPEP